MEFVVSEPPWFFVAVLILAVMHRKSLVFEDRCRYPLNEHIDLIQLLLIKILKSKLVRDNCMFTNACM